MNNSESYPVFDLEHREHRFHQTNQVLPLIFPKSSQLDTGKLQLVVTRGAMYLLDIGSSGKKSRKVIVSSDGKSQYDVDFINDRMKSKRRGRGVHVRNIFDVTEATLEAAFALVLANRYGALREEQIRGNERELLGKYELMIRKEEEYTLAPEQEISEKLAA